MDDRLKRPAPTPHLAPDARGERLGLILGLAMALGAATSFAVARAGIVGGLGVLDITVVRFAVAGLVMLPFLVRWGVPTMAGIGWGRGLVLAATGGLFFSLPQTAGYAFAPLAHGAVIAPATVTIVGTIMAATFLGERLGLKYAAGAACVLAGIVMISWEGLAKGGGGQSWIGDLLFVASSVFWAVYTVLLRHWRVDAMRATAVVAVLSSCVATPAYLALVGPGHLLALPLAALALQGAVQGGVQSIATIMAYSQAVTLLGVSRAVLFPALVPAISIIVGIPIVGEIPSPTQILGLCLVTAGLLVIVGAADRLARAARRAR